MRIAGSTALVTGANRGLGRAFVEVLLEAGASKIYACARNPESLSDLVRQSNQRVIALQVDVTNQQDVSLAAEQASDVTLLINNAGILESKGLIEAGTIEPLMREMEANVYGLGRMCLAFAPVLKSNGGGGIVNILSVAAWQNIPCFGTYSASKAAAQSLTQCVRVELRENNTQVFAAYAGAVDTPMLAKLGIEKASPASFVLAVLRGVEANTLEIDADETAMSIREALRTDPAGLEAATNEWSRNIKALCRQS